MITPDDGGPAFPETRWDDKTRQEVQWCGMSLRDWFAGKALSGLLACGRLGDLLDEDEIDDTPRAVCLKSYKVADAMLKVRNQ